MRVSQEEGEILSAKHRGPHGESSVLTVVSTTNTAQGRLQNAQMKQGITKATVKEVDVVRHGVKRLETRMHELESRVQYVNPWVVQYMWELLCKLREKIGVHANEPHDRSVERCLRGGRAQPSTEPRRANAASALSPNSRKANVRSPSGPLRLFEASVDTAEAVSDEFDTSLSSESAGSAAGETEEVHRDKRQQQQQQQLRRMEKKVQEMEERMLWECAAQNERAARMDIAMEESAARSLLLVQHTHCMAVSMSRVQHNQMQMVPCGAFRPENVCYAQDKEDDERRVDELRLENHRERHLGEIPSPPEIFNECSPILPTGDFSFDPISPPRHRHAATTSSPKNDKTCKSCGKSDAMNGGSNNFCRGAMDSATSATIVESLMRDPEARHSLVEEILRDLTASVRQPACNTHTTTRNSRRNEDLNNLHVNDSLASALLTAVRDAAIGDEMRQWSARDDAARAAADERFFQREAEWERHAVAELREAHEQQRSVLARGREDADACRAMRNEMRQLYDAFTRAAEPFVEGLGLKQTFHHTGKSLSMREWETPCAAVSSLLSGVAADEEALRARKGTPRTREPELPQNAKQLQTHASSDALTQQEQTLDGPARTKTAESHISTLQARMADVQEAIAIVARKLRAAEERLDTSKASSAEMQSVTERLRTVERQLDKLPALIATPTLSPLAEPKDAEQCSSCESPLNFISVEAAMMSVQEILHTQPSVRAAGSHAQALSALCAILKHVVLLYNNGTGTIGGNLQLIFAMPPFAVPASIVPACRAYLREHSAAELKEAVATFAFSKPVAAVLCDVYYWIQSHVLAADDAQLRRIVETAGKNGNSKSVQVEEESLEKGRSIQGTHSKSIQTNEGERTNAAQREQITWACNTDTSGQTQSQQLAVPSNLATPCGATKGSIGYSALEELARISSPDDFNGKGGNHISHRLSCRADGYVSYTIPDAFSNGVQKTKNEMNTSLFYSNSVAVSPFNAANKFTLRRGGSFLNGGPGEAEAAPLFKSSESSAHYHRYQKDLSDGSECLPLPTAVSAFTDPQMPKSAEGRVRIGMKNPQSFYTATSVRPAQKQQTLEVRHKKK